MPWANGLRSAPAVPDGKQGRLLSAFWNIPIKIKELGTEQSRSPERRKLLLLWPQPFRVHLGTRALSASGVPARTPPGRPAAGRPPRPSWCPWCLLQSYGAPDNLRLAIWPAPSAQTSSTPGSRPRTSRISWCARTRPHWKGPAAEEPLKTNVLRFPSLTCQEVSLMALAQKTMADED